MPKVKLSRKSGPTRDRATNGNATANTGMRRTGKLSLFTMPKRPLEGSAPMDMPKGRYNIDGGGY